MAKGGRELHWSVDFVEHLRTVHFALTGLAAALIILALASPDERVSRALTQASLLSELQEQGRWERFRKQLYQKAIGFQSGYTANVHVEGRKQDLITIDLPDDYLFVWHTWHFNSDMVHAPVTVDDYQKWWDSIFQEKLAARFIDVKQEPVSQAFCFHETPGQQIANTERLYCEEDPVLGAGFNVEFGDTLTKSKGHGTEEPHIASLTVRFQLRSDSTQHVYMLPVETKAFPVHQSDVLEFLSASEGPFSRAFGDLAEMSSSFKGLSMKAVASRLTDLAPKGTQLFEAIGIKVPAAYVTRWGLIILLGVQVYFWLHLHEFRVKAKPDSPGFDVAWIGVYKSWPAFTMMVVSACIVPTAALVVMCMKTPSVVGIALSILLGGSAVFGTAWRLWAVRTLHN